MDYYIISRRYVCRACERRSKDAAEAAVEAARTAAAAAGMRVEDMDVDNSDSEQYSYMGYDLRSRQLLPFGYGDEFPAFLTHRGGVDKEIVDLQRPLFDRGVRPESLSAVLLELHAKRYTEAYLRREHLLQRARRFNAKLDADMFSSFGDKCRCALCMR